MATTTASDAAVTAGAAASDALVEGGAKEAPEATEGEEEVARKREAMAVAAFQAGEAALGGGNAEAALSFFMRAAVALPGWPDAWQRIGVCYHRLRNFDSAAASMRRGLDIGGWEDVGAILTLMDTLRELGRLSDIIFAAERVPAKHPLAHFAALLAGWAAFALSASTGTSSSSPGGAGPAAAWFQKALAREPSNVLYRYLSSAAAAAAADQGSQPELLEPLEPFGDEALDNDELFVQLRRAQHHLDSPSLRALNDKVELHKLLKASEEEGASFWPRGFVLPAEREAALEAEKTPPEPAAGAAAAPRWVCKRAAGMGGQGVTVHASVADAAEHAAKIAGEGGGEEESLLQEYIQPPLLIGDRKFSIRAFLVLYLGAGGPAAYVATRALALFAPVKWSEEALGGEGSSQSAASPHLTNQSASQQVAPGEALTREVSELPADDLAAAGWPGGQASLLEAAQLAAEGLLRAAQKQRVLERSVGEYEPERGLLVPKLLGLDLLPEASSGGRPPRAWLLEVNRHPSMGEAYDCARRVKRRAMLDAWSLLWRSGAGGSGGGGPPRQWPAAFGCLRRVA